MKHYASTITSKLICDHSIITTDRVASMEYAISDIWGHVGHDLYCRILKWWARSKSGAFQQIPIHCNNWLSNSWGLNSETATPLHLSCKRRCNHNYLVRWNRGWISYLPLRPEKISFTQTVFSLMHVSITTDPPPPFWATLSQQYLAVWRLTTWLYDSFFVHMHLWT